MKKFSKPPDDAFPEVRTGNGTLLPVAQLLECDPEQLSAEFEHYASWYATIAFAHHMARERADAAERVYEQKRAVLYFEVRKAIETELKVKATVDNVAYALDANEDIIEAKEKLADLRSVERRLDVLRRSFDAKKEMLISLGAQTRSEMKNL